MSDLIIVDATGLKCPLPLLKLKQALRNRNPSQQVKLIASDVGSKRDVPTYLQMSQQHHLVDMIEYDDGKTEFVVEVTR